MIITSHKTNTYTIITLDRQRNCVSIFTELQEVLSESQRRQIMEQFTWRSERVKIVCYFHPQMQRNKLNCFQTAQIRFYYDLRIGIPLHKHRHGNRTTSRTRQISPNFKRNPKQCSSSVGSASSSMAPKINCYAYALKHRPLELELFPVPRRWTCKPGISDTSSIQSTLSKRTLSKPDTSLKRTANLVTAE